MKKNKMTNENKNKLNKLAYKIENKVNTSYVGSDPTRVKMLYLLHKNKKMCTSELAEILEVTVSAVSHQKAILERFGLIESDREGKKICCHIKNNKLAKEILKELK